MKNFLKVVLISILCSCSSASDTEEAAFSLAVALEKVQSKEELKEELKNLEKQFNQIAELVAQDRGGKISKKTKEKLLSEMKRLYAIEGGRALIEQSQKEAVAILESYERKSLRKASLSSSK